MKQKRQALQLKGKLLCNLDDEIVEMVKEDGLAEEIEEADIIRD